MTTQNKTSGLGNKGNSRKAWAHHPRGGIIEGYASKVYSGLYGKERKIAPTLEDAESGLGVSVPAEQVFFTPPPSNKKQHTPGPWYCEP